MGLLSELRIVVISSHYVTSCRVAG
uniref:Uncharacterized protein n=1 Tax=Anguilla anguilla TaxID=7936 RepID=A0A0E9S3R8_ANGAN